MAEEENKQTPEEVLAAAEKQEKEFAVKRKEELEALEKRIDEKTQNLQRLTKEIEVSGKSIVGKDQSKEQRIKDETNKLLEGTGLKV